MTILAFYLSLYLQNDVVQNEYLDVFNDDVDFAKISTSKAKPKKQPQKSSTKPIKREVEESKNGFIKPCYPYSCLITLALKNSSNGQLSVSDIYSFVWYAINLISSFFAYTVSFSVKTFLFLNTLTQDGRILFDTTFLLTNVSSK